MASMPTGRPEADNAKVRMASGDPGAVPMLTGRPECGSNWWISGSDSALPSEAAIDKRPCSRNQERYARDVEHGTYGVDDRLEQILDRPVLYQQLGELEEAMGLDRSPLGLGPCRLQAGHDPGHEQHDDHVDAEGHPVLGSAGGHRVVGGNETRGRRRQIRRPRSQRPRRIRRRSLPQRRARPRPGLPWRYSDGSEKAP